MRGKERTIIPRHVVGSYSRNVHIRAGANVPVDPKGLQNLVDVTDAMLRHCKLQRPGIGPIRFGKRVRVNLELDARVPFGQIDINVSPGGHLGEVVVHPSNKHRLLFNQPPDVYKMVSAAAVTAAQAKRHFRESTQAQDQRILAAEQKAFNVFDRLKDKLIAKAP